ncbi:hypothetical protein B0T26DRAFT_63768 [Lasiosphaeria miniovina]|uniref:Uncharacterized protein n=1 Tax=Lasiosphaeria miniovina TaxID=1954250 RepID=A0AA40BHF4_9PEZI|nr:uncharacterized protein B0T26DRAFT_63768 [Lasiosphaeria miniovina]KAK0734292.1 hypothetical protein B0T26DRAFT_63768 [Lasiosphaeria miniovina]
MLVSTASSKSWPSCKAGIIGQVHKLKQGDKEETRAPPGPLLDDNGATNTGIPMKINHFGHAASGGGGTKLLRFLERNHAAAAVSDCGSLLLVSFGLFPPSSPLVYLVLLSFFFILCRSSCPSSCLRYLVAVRYLLFACSVSRIHPLLENELIRIAGLISIWLLICGGAWPFTCLVQCGAFSLRFPLLASGPGYFTVPQVHAPILAS